MSKFLFKFIGLGSVLATLLLSFYTISSSAADKDRHNALIDSMQIQTIVATTDASAADNKKMQTDKEKVLCDKKQQQKPAARKEISWIAWLTGSHKAPSLHFLDILELFGL